MMSGIKAKDTKPELIIRKALHAAGFRYRLHVKTLPGKPDLVFPKYKAVIFIHGCFWHGHDCRYFKIPQTRTSFWLNKIRGNKARDLAQQAQLEQQGWRVMIIWECAIRHLQKSKSIILIDYVIDWLIMDASCKEIDETTLPPCSKTE